MGVQRSLILAIATTTLLAAGESWQKKDHGQWSASETQQILTDSAWTKHSGGYIGTTDEDPHTYQVKGPSAHDIGLGGPANNDWFPVGKLPPTRMPTLPVTIRWDSAQPVREALVQSHAPNAADSEHSLTASEKYYVITVLGLAATHKPGEAEQERFDENRMRQGLVDRSRLLFRDRKPIVPEDARVDQATGAIHLYFPKDKPITLDDKEVAFSTVFGSVRVVQKFRLKDMVYKGQLSL
jgi:hypothetical protein